MMTTSYEEELDDIEACADAYTGEEIPEATGEPDDHVDTYDAYYKSDEFFPRLKRDWLEPTEQLHSGGWEITRDMADFCEHEIGLNKPRALDLCCGEGATANYLALERGWKITGLDVNPSAISKAQEDAKSSGSGVEFILCSAFRMDAIPDNTFQLVYGQDPDALASPQRIRIFRHIYRVLKPGGFFTFHHHWVPGFNWRLEDLERYWVKEQTTDLCAEYYITALEQAGFEVLIKEDITRLASSHLRGCYARNQARSKREGPEVLDRWLERTIEELDKGRSFGLRVVAMKPVE